MSEVFVGKRRMKELGMKNMDARGSAPSAFALKQLQKYGWKECVAAAGGVCVSWCAVIPPIVCRGMGLGKHATGDAKHVSVKKRDDSNGGVSAASAAFRCVLGVSLSVCLFVCYSESPSLYCAVWLEHTLFRAVFSVFNGCMHCCTAPAAVLQLVCV